MVKFPKRTKITGRKSTIANAFVIAITPVLVPTDSEVDEALRILEMSRESLQCCYCGDPASEWDHLRPLVRDTEPTGYITEIANLVPSCGKCNQSKGGKPWREWIESTAKRSPRSRGINDLDERKRRIEAYEQWKTPRKIDFKSMVGNEIWEEYRQSQAELIKYMAQSQELAAKILSYIQSQSDG